MIKVVRAHHRMEIQMRDVGMTRTSIDGIDEWICLPVTTTYKCINIYANYELQCISNIFHISSNESSFYTYMTVP